MKLKLGLIGISIAASRAPFLHQKLGSIYGAEVTYDLNDPQENSVDAFADTLQRLRQQGYTGCNVTYPFKQLAMQFVDTADAAATTVGATNTLYFANGEVFATNTDYSGFIHGYRHRRADKPAGTTLLIGAGGVGRAVAFGLYQVGGTKTYIFDLNEAGAQSLADALNNAGYLAEVITTDQLPSVAKSVDGLVNCTPIGHLKSPGNPLDANLFGGQSWAFDAVYTPMDTEFLQAAHSAGLDLVSGFDLFYYQGIDAYQTFSQSKIDPLIALEPFKKEFNIHSDLID